MKELQFGIDTRSTRSATTAFLDEEYPREGLVDAAIGAISTDVEIQVGDVKMHLAAWMDPEHWATDWEQIGVDPDELLQG